MFQLDPRLAADGPLLPQLCSFAQVILKQNRDYPWLVVVPTVPGVVELYDLTKDQQERLWHTVGLVARAFKQWTGADKINIAALGNIVSQFHVHIIARSHQDPTWPNSVWSSTIEPGNWLTITPMEFESQLKSLMA